MTLKVAVVAYGNPLRGDDGVAWEVARRLQRKRVPGLQILACRQLTPELSEALKHAERVIFVDAGQGDQPGEICSRSLEKAQRPPTPAFGHSLTPEAIMALLAGLHGARPEAHIVAICGRRFDHGDALSAPVRAAIPGAVSRVLELIGGVPNTSPP
jgi:hydrogenase maturation protease